MLTLPKVVSCVTASDEPHVLQRTVLECRQASERHGNQQQSFQTCEREQSAAVAQFMRAEVDVSDMALPIEAGQAGKTAIVVDVK
jgi:hypothetical protein